MRSRNIKTGFWENEHIGKLSHTERLLFIGLWCIADKEGKLEDRPDRIRHLLFGYDKRPPDVEKGLCNLMSLHLITRYDISGERYILIDNFKKHQNPHPRELSMKIPDPVTSREISCNAIKLSVDIRNNDIRNHESKDYCAEPKETSAHTQHPEPPLLTFPTVGKAKEWHLTQDSLDKLTKAFPDAPVLDECKRALGWLEMNPPRRKTPNGMGRFLYSWIMRAQNKGGYGKAKEPKKEALVL